MRDFFGDSGAYICVGVRTGTILGVFLVPIFVLCLGGSLDALLRGVVFGGVGGAVLGIPIGFAGGWIGRVPVEDCVEPGLRDCLMRVAPVAGIVGGSLGAAFPTGFVLVARVHSWMWAFVEAAAHYNKTGLTYCALFGAAVGLVSWRISQMGTESICGIPLLSIARANGVTKPLSIEDALGANPIKLLSHMLTRLGLGGPIVAGAIPYALVGPFAAWTVVDVAVPTSDGPWRNILVVAYFGLVHGAALASVLISRQVRRFYDSWSDEDRSEFIRAARTANSSGH